MKKVCSCGAQSIPGLKKGIALCPYHYAERQWGKAWADQCYPQKKEKKEA